MSRRPLSALLPLVVATGCQGYLNTSTHTPSASSSSASVSSSSSSPESSSSSSTSSAGTDLQDGQPTHAYDHLPPYPAAPADPWSGVEGDQPRRMSRDEAAVWSVRGNDFACTSLHDHCFSRETWLIETEASARRATFRTAAAYGFGPEGPVLPGNAKNGALPYGPYTAYRSVPATRTNLVPGALVFALTFPTTHVTRGSEVFDVTWNAGIVDRVDWDLGFVYLEGQDRTYWITATRTAVLSWQEGGKVEIVGGRRRDQLAVSKDDVVLPDAPPQP